MIDVLFIVPNSSAEAYQELASTHSAIETPTWSLLLAQAVRLKGFKTEILDCDALRLSDEKAIEEIKSLKPRISCFVLYGQNPNSGTTSMIGASRLASKLKETFLNTKTVFVGSHVSALPREVLSNTYVDIVLQNEGVYSLIELLNSNLTDISKIDGIGYKEADGQLILAKKSKLVAQARMDIDMPGYAWDLLPKDNRFLDKYRAHLWHTNFLEDDRSPFASIYTSLGCQFGCNFCMINILNRTDSREDAHSGDYRGMRFWSPELVLNQLGILAYHGVKTVRLADEMFFLNKKYYVPILEGIIERGFKFNMWAYARVDTIRPDQLQLFKKAGINWLCLGIEAGNENVRLEIEKGRFQDVNIREVVKLIEDHDIEVLGNYMFGFPGDTFETMQQTLDLAIELNTRHANFYPTQALPGSQLYFMAKNEGWDLPTKFEEFAFLSYECKPLPTRFVSAKNVLQFRDDAWHKYFIRRDYLDKVKVKFGGNAAHNIEKMAEIKLKRKLLNN